MSRRYKNIKNGNGTELTIDTGKYISVGKDGYDITIRGNEKVIAFDTWEEFVHAINIEESSYYKNDNFDYQRIGKCVINSNGVILELKKQYFRQGYIFKDYYAFHNKPKSPCYIPELSETVYTAEDFLYICNGQKELAKELFYTVDWQHPENQVEEWFANGEWSACKKCKKIFNSYGTVKCPYCETKLCERRLNETKRSVILQKEDKNYAELFILHSERCERFTWNIKRTCL